MSATPQLVPPPSRVPIPMRRSNRGLSRALGTLVAIAAVGAIAWGAWRAWRSLTPSAVAAIPTARVQRGDINIEVHGQGSLKGGHSEMLVAPPVAGGAMSIKFLLPPGAAVKAGDEVVAFDTAAQEYNLTQAQEAVEQAQQQVVQAQATAAAQDEDDSYQLLKANYDVQRAQLQVRRNPTLAAVDAQKNNLTLSAAQAHLTQLQKDVASRQAGNVATIAVQQAAVKKAQADVATAQHNISSMTLRAQQSGYVAVQSNTSSQIIFAGMSLPAYQVGDTARPGQAVVQIPDTSSWEVDVDVSELDAGHLVPGLACDVQFVSLPGQVFAGTVQSVGAASGPPWKRIVPIVATLSHPTPSLRPGLSANAVITTARLHDALWVPSTAVFEIGGRSLVFRQTHGQFNRQPVTVIQRSESQVAIQGISQNDIVALANPELQPQAAKPAPGRGSPAAAVGGKG